MIYENADFLNVALRYSNIPEETKKHIRENQYLRIEILSGLEMFENDTIPFNTFRLGELLNILHGCFCLGRVAGDDKLVVGMPVFTELDEDMIPKLTGAKTLLGTEMTEYYLIRNNTLMAPEIMILERYAEQLARIDFSQKKLAQKSICNPIPVAHDKSTYNTIVESLKNSGNDDILVAYKEDDFEEAMERVDNTPIMYDFTNINYADKFKYLSQYHLDLTSRLYFLYGFAMQAPMKLAHENSDELAYRDETSDIYISNMYHTRMDDYEKACAALGIENHFKFSETWKRDIVTSEDSPLASDDEEPEEECEEEDVEDES